MSTAQRHALAYPGPAKLPPVARPAEGKGYGVAKAYYTDKIVAIARHRCGR